jgi:hypothetical protein
VPGPRAKLQPPTTNLVLLLHCSTHRSTSNATTVPTKCRRRQQQRQGSPLEQLRCYGSLPSPPASAPLPTCEREEKGKRKAEAQISCHLQEQSRAAQSAAAFVFVSPLPLSPAAHRTTNHRCHHHRHPGAPRARSTDPSTPARQATTRARQQQASTSRGWLGWLVAVVEGQGKGGMGVARRSAASVLLLWQKRHAHGGGGVARAHHGSHLGVATGRPAPRIPGNSWNPRSAGVGGGPVERAEPMRGLSRPAPEKRDDSAELFLYFKLFQFKILKIAPCKLKFQQLDLLVASRSVVRLILKSRHMMWHD